MLRVFIVCLAQLFLVGCEETKPGSYQTEELLLKALVYEIGVEMGKAGFLVNTKEVKVRVESKPRMKEIFNNLSEISRTEIKNEHLVSESTKALEKDDSARLAFYDANSKTIIFAGGSVGEISPAYIAHELAHVYQDQKWGLENIWQPYQKEPSREMFNITQYMVEGHAEMAKEAYEQMKAKDLVELSDLTVNLGRVFDSECVLCDDTEAAQSLPYSLGLRFLLHQYKKGGWAAAEKFIEVLPSSSEQIIHPAKLKDDLPRKVSLPFWEDKNHPGSLSLNGVMGQAFLLEKLLKLGLPKSEAFTSSSGWDGDIAHFYLFEDGSEAMVWRIIFDRDEDAQQLENSLRKVKLSKEVMRVGRTIDWISTKNSLIEAKLRIFLSKNPILLPEIQLDEVSTKKVEEEVLDEVKSDSMFFNPPKRTRLVIEPKGL